MALPRESTLLPTIKCSSCGNQVEISMMGDHLCGGPTAELSPPPEAGDEFDHQFNQVSYGKYGRTPSPQVDTGAANRPFMSRGQLTPVSQPSESRNVSPVAPSGRPHDFARSPGHVRRPGGYGAFDEPEPSLTRQGAGLLDRMNSIAPGPFDTGRRSPSTRDAFDQREVSLDKWHGRPPDQLDRPGTSNSNALGAANIILAPPKMPRKNGYGGFGPPSNATDEFEPVKPGLISRSDTYPKPSPAADAPRRLPSAPGERSDRARNTGNFADDRKNALRPDMSRKPPPRTSLLAQHIPKNSATVDLAAEFGVSNPYHTPSDSASSGYSMFSHPSQASSQTSPARSQTHRSDFDSPPKTDRMMTKPQASMESLRPRDLRIDPAFQGASLRAPSPLADSPYGLASTDEERYDPAVQSGQLSLSPLPRGYDRPMASPRYGSSPQREPAHDYWHARTGASPPSRQAARVPRKGSRDPVALPSRGDCKACRLPIKGKSISSADGRLTGKYHKACFVCTTCSEPFTSAEFYVLGDEPYCEQHYHKLNGSLCGSCGRGIEGQYLEDESRIKYHLGCFRCLDCDRSLSDGYFEVDGKAYCERDAWKRTQPTPSIAYGAVEYGGAGPRSAPGMGGGLPGRPGIRAAPGGMLRPPASGSRLGLGMGAPRPQMNKRMTRLGQM